MASTDEVRNEESKVFVTANDLSLRRPHFKSNNTCWRERLFAVSMHLALYHQHHFVIVVWSVKEAKSADK